LNVEHGIAPSAASGLDIEVTEDVTDRKENHIHQNSIVVRKG
jgi:hypothetical protein